MPYTKDRKQLPDYVAALDDKDLRNQWVDIFNSSYAAAKQDGKDDKEAEAIAFRNANGVLKRRGVKLSAADGGDMGLVSLFANFAKTTKTEDGTAFPAEAYAYVPDPSSPSTWKLRLWETPASKETARQVGMAAAALSSGGFRGNKAEIPSKDLAAVKRKVRAAWKRVNPDAKDSEMPESIQMSAAFAVTDPEAGIVRHWGKLFNVGDYPDHAYAMTPEELAAAVVGFQPAPVDLEHRPSLLDGKLGTLESVELSDDGQELYGTVALPAWLDAALGDAARTVSTTWDRATKQLTGLALVTDPAVPDAVLMAAFSGAQDSATVGAAALASPRHDTHQGQMALQRVHDMAASAGAVCKQGNAQMASSHEAKAMQGIHDIAADHGAVCSAMPKDSKGRMWPADQPLAAYGAQEKKMGFWEEMKAKFGEPPADPQTPAPVTPPAPAATPPDETAAQLAATQAALFAERAELARVRMQVIQDRAAAFADKAIADLLAYPAEREHLIACHVQAALDDHQLGTVQFNNQKTTRVALFEQEIAARPEHGLTKEEVGGLSATGMQVLLNQQKTATPQTGSPERIQKLKEMTPVGRDALKNGHSN